MTEPRYIPLRELRQSPNIPQEVLDIIMERHIRLRNQIRGILGEIELAFRRGYQAGYDDGSKKKKRKYG